MKMDRCKWFACFYLLFCEMSLWFIKFVWKFVAVFNSAIMAQKTQGNRYLKNLEMSGKCREKTPVRQNFVCRSYTASGERGRWEWHNFFNPHCSTTMMWSKHWHVDNCFIRWFTIGMARGRLRPGWQRTFLCHWRRGEATQIENRLCSRDGTT